MLDICQLSKPCFGGSKLYQCHTGSPLITTSLFPKSYTILVGMNGIIPLIRNPTVNTAIFF